jgi:hypothetical protein
LEALLRAFERHDRKRASAVTKFFAVVVAVLAAASAETYTCLAQALLHEKL